MKGGDEVIILFLAGRIVLGTLEFKDVPAVLKEKVKAELDSQGLEFLTVEE